MPLLLPSAFPSLSLSKTAPLLNIFLPNAMKRPEKRRGRGLQGQLMREGKEGEERSQVASHRQHVQMSQGVWGNACCSPCDLCPSPMSGGQRRGQSQREEKECTVAEGSIGWQLSSLTR